MTKYDWTPERLEQLFTPRTSGLSFDKIGPIMGLSKNAALGMYRRQCEKRGILRPVKPRKQILAAIAEKREKITPELKRDTIPKRKYTTAADRINLSRQGVGFVFPAVGPARRQKGRAVGILDVTGCRWPVADDPALIGGQAFCNAAQKDGSSYCSHHAREAVAPYSRELIRKTVKSLGPTVMRFDRRAA